MSALIFQTNLKIVASKSKKYENDVNCRVQEPQYSKTTLFLNIILEDLVFKAN